MSVVVAIKDNDKIWMGCDSQVTKGNSKATLKTQQKIWKASDDKDVLMGCVGYVRDMNIISTSEKLLEELSKLKNEINFKYIVRNLVPKIFSQLKEFSRLYYDNGICSMNSCFLFAYKDSCYMIENSGGVIVDDFLAIGSGETLAYGAYNTLKNTDMSKKEILIQTIKSSCESDLYVNYPIIVMNSLDDEVEIIER